MITCQFEHGAQTSLRHVTVNAIVLKDNKILLGKRGTHNGRKILEYGKWALLGGFLNRDETLEEAAQREVREESGWEITNLRLFRINDNPQRPAEDRQNVDVIFLADAVNQVNQPDEEVTELKWFDTGSLPSPEELAFDNSESLEFYKRYLAEKFSLPILGAL